jgi:hypothetical protein
MREVFLIKVKLARTQIGFKGSCVKKLNDALLKYVAESKEKSRNKM